MDMTVYENGIIYVGQGALVESIAVANGKIKGCGSTIEISAQFPKARKIDLQKKLVLPTFIDAHTHFLSYCIKQNQIDLNGLMSAQLCLEKIRAHVKKIPAGGWIKGSGWNHNLWDPSHYPTHHDLDEISKEHPICLDARDYHSAWCNSKALEMAGITSLSTWNNTGEIVKDHSGQPTGIIKEEARQLIWNVMGADSVKSRVESLRAGQHLAFQNGLSGVGCMETMEDWEAYQFLHQNQELKLRVAFYWPIRYLEDAIKLGMKSGSGDETLIFAGMKIFLDGTLGSQTAHMLEPFEGSSNHGTEIISQKDADDFVLRAAESDIACAIHAIGDGANRKALNAFEKAKSSFRNNSLRQRIEHAQIIHPTDIPRFAELNVIASMQAIHIPEDIDSANKYWGARARYAYPFRSLLQSGATVALGSDVPIETCNVFDGIYAALKRTRRGDLESWYPEESMDLKEIIHAYTVGAAYATGEEKLKGTLEPGKAADFMILSEDIFAIAPEEIPNLYVERMFIAGEEVYAR